MTTYEIIRHALDLARRQNEVASKHKREEGHCGVSRIHDEQADQMRHALSLLDSHAVVPRDPTDKQYEAASDADNIVEWQPDDTNTPMQHYHDIYKAMIQAAQEAQDE
jgi:hypothetical protein